MGIVSRVYKDSYKLIRRTKKKRVKIELNI